MLAKARRAGKRYVLLTNKGSNAVPMQVVQDGVTLTNLFLETYVAGTDPSATNAPPPYSTVQIRSQMTNNPVALPGYGVVRLEWTVFAVPRPVLTITSTNSTHVLSWTGLTNVTYWVQSATNLHSTWATLGKVASARTNFSFINCCAASAQFYRLAVP